MREMLAHADLARYAGQFVWLEVNFDAAANRTFLDRYGAAGTPTFYILDPQDAHVVATQPGAMSYVELTAFLEHGRRQAGQEQAVEAAPAHGNALLARAPADAAKAYREALHAASAAWPQRALAEASLVGALRSAGASQDCAETAATTVARLPRGPLWTRVVVDGMWCLTDDPKAGWSEKLSVQLLPLAQEALALPSTIRDRRDELYRTPMMLAVARGEPASAARWGNLWLAELDAIHPDGDEERMAIDIARVENIEVYGDPKRILPALLRSERDLATNWNASLRVAQMEMAANAYEAAIAACDRGLARSPGPLGRAWLLEIKADGLTARNRYSEARATLDQAMAAARAIPLDRMRASNLDKINTARALLPR